MTHTSTEQERKLFEAFASDNGGWPKAIERDAKGNYLLLTTAVGWMWWQAARRAPAAPVPQGLRKAAQAVVDRWDTPLWKDVPATAVYIADLRAALAAAPQPPEAVQSNDWQQASATAACWCETCDTAANGWRTKMALCPQCCNKRCPRATHHDKACTGSNEPGQKGSSWEHVPPAPKAQGEQG